MNTLLWVKVLLSPLVFDKDAHPVARIHVIVDINLADERVGGKQSQREEEYREPEQWRRMSGRHKLDLGHSKCLRDPDVENVDDDREDRIEQEVRARPPASPGPDPDGDRNEDAGERRERNRPEVHVDARLVEDVRLCEDPHGQEVDDDGVEQSVKVVLQVILYVIDCFLRAHVVHLRVELAQLDAVHQVVDVLLEDCLDHDWPRGVEQVVKADVEVIIDRLAREPVDPSEEEVRHCQHHILVEEVEHHFGVAQVEQPAVHEQKPPKHLELTEREVRRVDSLHALVAVQADADVSLADHGNIVGTVTNGEGDRFGVVLFDETDNISFLGRRNATNNDCFAGLADLDKVALEFEVTENDCQSLGRYKNSLSSIRHNTFLVVLGHLLTTEFLDMLSVLYRVPVHLLSWLQ